MDEETLKLLREWVKAEVEAGIADSGRGNLGYQIRTHNKADRLFYELTQKLPGKKGGLKMGWCSATEIFDHVAGVLLGEDTKDPKEVLTELAWVLRDRDWDCEQESRYYDHPVVQEVMKEVFPQWSDD